MNADIGDLFHHLDYRGSGHHDVGKVHRLSKVRHRLVRQLAVHLLVMGMHEVESDVGRVPPKVRVCEHRPLRVVSRADERHGPRREQLAQPRGDTFAGPGPLVCVHLHPHGPPGR